MCPRSIAGVLFDSVRRFRATLLLRTTCMCLYCDGVASCVAAWQTKNQKTYELVKISLIMSAGFPRRDHVRITIDNLFHFHKDDSMKSFVNWILVNMHVRFSFNQTQPYLKEGYLITAHYLCTLLLYLAR